MLSRVKVEAVCVPAHIDRRISHCMTGQLSRVFSLTELQTPDRPLLTHCSSACRLTLLIFVLFLRSRADKLPSPVFAIVTLLPGLLILQLFKSGVLFRL